MQVFWIILGSIFGILILLLLICLIRAATSKAKAPAKLTKDLSVDDDRAQKYAKTLSQMIQCETISINPEESLDKFYQFHDVIEKLFPQIHKNAEKNVFDGSLLFKWKGGGAQPILLMSHHDVVEASGTWKYPPFSGEIAEGSVWGRGTQDTKGSLFGILQAVEELMADGYKPAGDVYIASTCNEETNGSGARAIVSYLQEQGVHLELLVDEGGAIPTNPIPGVNGTFAMVGVLEKGYGDLKFTAKGIGGHSSVQQKNTPLARLAKFIVDAEKHDPFTPTFNGTVNEMFTRMSPHMDFGMRFIFANLWLFRPLLRVMLGKINPMAGAMIKTTLSFTMAKGSDGYNVIPNVAYVTGNLRFSPDQDRDESVAIMTNLAKKYDLETEVIQSNAACKVVSHTSGAFARVEKALGETFPGIVVTPYAMTGGTDARYYTSVCDNALRIAPILCTNEQLSTIHSYDENISISTLPSAVDFYKKVVQLGEE